MRSLLLFPFYYLLEFLADDLSNLALDFLETLALDKHLLKVFLNYSKNILLFDCLSCSVSASFMPFATAF
jgi:hypothetical protein